MHSWMARDSTSLKIIALCNNGVPALVGFITNDHDFPHLPPSTPRPRVKARGVTHSPRRPESGALAVRAIFLALHSHRLKALAPRFNMLYQPRHTRRLVDTAPPPKTRQISRIGGRAGLAFRWRVPWDATNATLRGTWPPEVGARCGTW